MQRLRMTSHAVQGIEGDALSRQVTQGFEQGVEMGDLVGLDADLSMPTYGVRFTVQCWHELFAAPATFLAPRTSLPSMAITSASTWVCAQAPRGSFESFEGPPGQYALEFGTLRVTKLAALSEVEAAYVEHSPTAANDVRVDHHCTECHGQDPSQLLADAFGLAVVRERRQSLKYWDRDPAGH